VTEEVGSFAGLLALVSIISIMVILLAVLGLVVVKALAESPWGLFTIAATMPIAVVMGLGMRTAGHNSGRLGWITAGGVVALLAAVYGGQFLAGTAWEGALTLKGTSLAWWIMGYGFLASILPVWLLLAPRDYLSTFMKIGTIAFLAIGVIIVNPTLQAPAFSSFVGGGGPIIPGPMFPFVFITIACGAISGFHSLIASGTTPKMVDKESDIRPIGYGAMLCEGFVGVMALTSLYEGWRILAIWIGVGFIFRGVATMSSAISDPTLPGRGWNIFVGAISLIAGVVVMAFPYDSLGTLALVVGVWLIVIGIMEVVTAFGIRGFTKSEPTVKAPAT